MAPKINPAIANTGIGYLLVNDKILPIFIKVDCILGIILLQFPSLLYTANVLYIKNLQISTCYYKSIKEHSRIISCTLLHLIQNCDLGVLDSLQLVHCIGFKNASLSLQRKKFN